MTIAPGDMLPDAELIRVTAEGPSATSMAELTSNRKVVIFALPGAFTPTCDGAHMPSFVRNAQAFAERGIDEILCLSVNDAFMMGKWGNDSGAFEAGIGMICDPNSAFTKAVGMAFSVPPIGFVDRSQRYAMVVENGKVEAIQIEEPGVCAVSTGEAMLETLGL